MSETLGLLKFETNSLNRVRFYMKPLPRNLYLSENIDENTAQQLRREIVEINESDRNFNKLFLMNEYGLYKPKPINLYIDSCGGSVDATLAIVDLIELSQTPVHTIVNGRAYSGAFIVAISGKVRYATKNSNYMLHQMSYEIRGTLKEVDEFQTVANRIQKKLLKIVTDKTNISKSQLDEMVIKKLDWYIETADAKYLNVFDHYLEQI